MATVHVLKSWPLFFGPIADGARSHELRRNDRNFAVGDTIELHEYDQNTQTYTGRTCAVKITSMTSKDVPCAVSDTALDPDYCILTVKVLANHPSTTTQSAMTAGSGSPPG